MCAARAELRSESRREPADPWQITGVLTRENPQRERDERRHDEQPGQSEPAHFVRLDEVHHTEHNRKTDGDIPRRIGAFELGRNDDDVGALAHGQCGTPPWSATAIG